MDFLQHAGWIERQQDANVESWFSNFYCIWNIISIDKIKTPQKKKKDFTHENNVYITYNLRKKKWIKLFVK